MLLFLLHLLVVMHLDDCLLVKGVSCLDHGKGQLFEDPLLHLNATFEQDVALLDEVEIRVKAVALFENDLLKAGRQLLE